MSQRHRHVRMKKGQVVTITPVATTTPRKEEPGFEAIFAIAGLLAVAFLVLRQRK
jgi:PGF-CTERM protein